MHPATPHGDDQAVMPTPRGRRLPPSHQGGGAWSMVSDGVGGNNDIKSDALKYYVNNHNEVVEKIMTDYSLEKGDVKQLFLSVMNGGKRNWILDPFFVKFKTECERIYSFIQKNYS